MDWLIAALTNFENALLLGINGANNEVLNYFMWHYSGKWIWIPFYLFLFYLIVRQYKWRQVIMISICIALVILFTDQLCASLIRPLVARDRPSHSEIGPLLNFVNNYKGGNYGFPSCHAANTAALTTFLGFIFRRRILFGALILWTLIMGYSRMYLGVHYPSDILTGYILGTLIGLIMGILWKHISRFNLKGHLKDHLIRGSLIIKLLNINRS
ncbi:MAG: phosphatase PAP2 family protein [Prevotella sp.]|nr:phosphatase PAP2 family protein [Bacteroides sp.]MCM1366373.1 phosphatase PAP2 family protein [Prevotella sp.]MCM1436698.1 phosphatase PAP2 family protein [Prevotella sp.]